MTHSDAAPDAMMWRQMPTTERTMVPAATRRLGELDLEPAIREQMEIQKLVAESGQSALKAMLFLNGGAAIAILAFLGAVLNRMPYMPPRLGA